MWPLIFVILFFLTAGINDPAAELLLHSSFEKGQTWCRDSLVPGTQSIVLIDNFNLNQWPDSNGEGIVQGDISGQAERFTYTSRKGTLLSGVKGIQKAHPAHSMICTQGYQELDHPNEYARCTDTAAMFGPYGLCIHVDSLVNSCILNGDFTFLKGLDKYWVQLYIRLDASLLASVTGTKRLKFHWLKQHDVATTFSQLQVGRAENDLRFYVRYGSLEDRDTLVSRVPVQADSIYCITYKMEKQDSNKMQIQWWINGVEQGIATVKRRTPPSPYFRVWTGFRNNIYKKTKFHGNMHIDEFMVSKKALGPIPRQPPVRMKQRGPALAPAPGLVTVQWQAGHGRSWLFPDIDTGEDTLLTALTVPPPVDRAVKAVFFRYRVKSAFGLWNDWSQPQVYTLPAEQDSGSRAMPLLTQVYLTDSLDKKRLQSIEKQTWFNLHLVYSVPDLKKDSIHTALWINHAQHVPASMNLIGGPFWHDRNYSFYLATKTGNINARTRENIMYSQSLKKDPQYFADGNRLTYPAPNHIRMPLRFPDKVRTGPWIVNAIAMRVNQEPQRVMRKGFFITPRRPDSPFPTTFIMLGLVMLAGLAAVVIRMRRRPELLASGSAVNTSNPVILQAIRYIGDHFRDPELSLESMAKHMNLNKSYFGKLFKKETGAAFSQYLIKVRIEEAKKLLENSNKRVLEIVFESGFTNQDYFFRLFKQHQGVTPKQYRQKYLNQSS